MAILNDMKNIVIYSALAASAFASSAALANTRDNMGLSINPSCDEMDVIKEAVLDEAKVTATGRKASNDKWDMELYTSKTGNWFVIGKDKTKPNSKLVCILDHGNEPIAKQKWAVLFDKSTTPRIAVAPIAKPTAN